VVALSQLGHTMAIPVLSKALVPSTMTPAGGTSLVTVQVAGRPVIRNSAACMSSPGARVATRYQVLKGNVAGRSHDVPAASAYSPIE